VHCGGRSHRSEGRVASVNVARQAWAIVAKDLLIEWRTRDLLATMVILGFTTVVLFNFAVDFARVPFSMLGAPVLWLAFSFTGFIGLTRSFALERQDSCLDGLLLAPVDRSVIYLGKLIVNFLVLTVLEVFLLALCVFFLNQGSGAVELPLSRWAVLVAVIALNTLGFASVGTLFALMVQRTRRGDVLLPVLQSILSLPVLIPAVLATRRLLDARAPLKDIAHLVQLSAVFAVVFIALSLVVFEYVVED
jgi:heme exporter protein B